MSRSWDQKCQVEVIVWKKKNNIDIIKIINRSLVGEEEKKRDSSVLNDI